MKKLAFLFCLLFHSIFAQQPSETQLKSRLASEKNTKKKFEILNELVSIGYENNLNSALKYAKMGVTLAEKTNDKNWKPKFYEMQGRMHANLIQLDSASLFFDKAMKSYKAVNDKRGQATTSFKMAWVARKKGMFEKSLEYDLYALKIMESLQDTDGTCSALGKVAEDFLAMERYTEAETYADKAIALTNDEPMSANRFFAMFIAGNVAINSGKSQLALNYYDSAKNIALKNEMGKTVFCDILNARGNALKRLAKYKEALAEYSNAHRLSIEANYRNATTATTANLGEINILIGNYKDALGYQLETVRLQEETNDMSNLVENYNHVSTIYNKLGNNDKALIFKQKAFVLRDSLASVESDAKMSEMLTKYETEQKEATIESQKTQISQQKIVQWLGIGIVVLLVGFIIFGFISYKNRMKTNRLLSAKNAENELLLKEIHHRVKNNLEIVSSLLALQSAQIDDPNTKDAMAESQNRVNSIGIVHQKLYQGEHLGSIEMKDYFQNLGESILDSFGAEDRISLDLPMEKIDLDIDTAVPLGLIMNELITNAVKYAFPDRDGKITIKLEKLDNSLHLEVSDDGIGKSGETKGTGFGTQLVSLLTNQLNGSMREENSHGTKLVFDFKTNRA